MGCSHVELPKVLNNDRIEKDGVISGFVEIQSPGLKLVDASAFLILSLDDEFLNIIFNQNEGKCYYYWAFEKIRFGTVKNKRSTVQTL